MNALNEEFSSPKNLVMNKVLEQGTQRIHLALNELENQNNPESKDLFIIIKIAILIYNSKILRT